MELGLNPGPFANCVVLVSSRHLPKPQFLQLQNGVMSSYL